MICASHVTKRFENKIALDDLNLHIENGTVFGLIGSNGSGKSTLLRLVSGVYRPDDGKVGIDGVNTYDNPALKSQIAFLGDTPYFLPQTDLEEMARLYESVYPNFDRETFRRLLSVFPLDTRARISTFSKGMQRQAALTLALSTVPRYLLLDEAFDGLDVVMRRVLANLIAEGMEQREMTTVIASHNLRELEDLGDRIGVLHGGKLLLNDTADQLRTHLYKVQAAFSHVPDLSVFSGLDVLKTERTGSLLQMVIRGEEEELLAFFRKLSPLFVECVAPSLEEVFIFELEAIGYDVKNILQ